MTILSKVHEPNSFKSYINIQDFSSFIGHECFLESSSPDISASYRTNLGDSIDWSNFFSSFMGYLSFIRKDSDTHIVLQFQWRRVFHQQVIYPLRILRIIFCFWLTFLIWCHRPNEIRIDLANSDYFCTTNSFTQNLTLLLFLTL